MLWFRLADWKIIVNRIEQLLPECNLIKYPSSVLNIPGTTLFFIRRAGSFSMYFSFDYVEVSNQAHKTILFGNTAQ